jgi:hypothetical protein
MLGFPRFSISGVAGAHRIGEMPEYVTRECRAFNDPVLPLQCVFRDAKYLVFEAAKASDAVKLFERGQSGRRRDGEAIKPLLLATCGSLRLSLARSFAHVQARRALDWQRRRKPLPRADIRIVSTGMIG